MKNANIYVLNFAEGLVVVESIHENEHNLRTAIGSAIKSYYDQMLHLDDPRAGTYVCCIDDVTQWEHGFRTLTNIPRPATPVVEPANDAPETKPDEFFAVTRWMIDDAIEAAKCNGVKMSEDGARKFWAENERGFKETLTETGNEILSFMDFSAYAE